MVEMLWLLCLSEGKSLRQSSWCAGRQFFKIGFHGGQIEGIYSSCYSSFCQLFRKKLSWAFSPWFGPWFFLYTFLASLIHSMHSSFIHLNSIHPLMSFYSVHRTEQAFGRVGKWLKLWFLYSRLTVVLEGSK